MINRGKILENYIRKEGYNLTQLGNKLPWTVKTMYRHFDDPDLPYDKLIHYSNVLGYDFRDEFPELSAHKWLLKEPKTEYKVTPKVGEDPAEFYRKKYEETLEKYNEVLERYTLILQNKTNPA